MAIKWGTAVANSTGNAMRLGYELSVSPRTIGQNTASVTVTLALYVGTQRTVYDSSNSWSIGGDFSGSGSVNISHGSSSSWSGANVTKIATRTRTVDTSFTGTTTVRFDASLSGVAPFGGTARVSGSVTVGRRPISAPRPPTNASVTRNGDTSQTVRWSNASPSDAGRPYQRVEIQRWDIASRAFKTIATLNGAPSSYTDKSTTANQQYQYRVRAWNSAGYTGFSTTDYVSTTPAAPGAPRATKTAAGDIRLTWSLSGVRKNTGIEVWLTRGGSDAGSRAALLPANATSWTHTDPAATSTWSYRLKATTGSDPNDAALNLYSGFSGRSNTVQLLTNPKAPTGLKPASVVRDGADPIELSWTHNEVDGTDQKAFEVQYRAAGTTAWRSTGKTTSTASKWTLPPATFENGQGIEWQVRTWGLYNTEPSASPWSAPALITLSTPPMVTVTAPEDGAVVGESAIAVAWEYFDPEQHPQARWRVTLLDAAGNTLETQTGTGADIRAYAFATVLADKSGYRVRVEGQDSTGLWSLRSEAGFTVAYPLPPTPTISAQWDHETGTVSVTIDNGAVVEGQAEPAHNQLWRSIDGGEWGLVAQQIPPNTAVTDFIPALGTINHYRVTAISALPSAADSEPVSADTRDDRHWVWVNAGPGFGQAVRIRDNAKVTASSTRAKVLREFAGRARPVEFAGDQRKRTVSLAARFAPDSSTPAEIEAIADLPAPACLRTPLGHRYFVSAEGPGISYERVTAELAWGFTEVDYTEQPVIGVALAGEEEGDGAA